MTAKPTRGRPAKPADQQTKPYSVRLTAARIEKLKAIGSARLNAWIDRAQIVSASDQRPNENSP